MFPNNGAVAVVPIGYADGLLRAYSTCGKLKIVKKIDGAKRVYSCNIVGNICMDLTMIDVSDIENVEIQSFSGLLVDFAKNNNANMVVRGLRAITDFEYEIQMAQTNRILECNVDTVFLTTNIEYSYLSSSTVKEVAMFGGDVSKFLPPSVVPKVIEKYKDIIPIFKINYKESIEF